MAAGDKYEWVSRRFHGLNERTCLLLDAIWGGRKRRRRNKCVPRLWILPLPPLQLVVSSALSLSCSLATVPDWTLRSFRASKSIRPRLLIYIKFGINGFLRLWNRKMFGRVSLFFVAIAIASYCFCFISRATQQDYFFFLLSATVCCSSRVFTSQSGGHDPNVLLKETTLERADFTLQLLMFVTAEKEWQMFIIFFLSSFCQLLSPRFWARIGWAHPDHEGSDQPA